MIHKSDGLEPGTWTHVLGSPSAKIACPRCGMIIYLEYHHIADSGKVEEEVRCLMDDCRYVDYVMLDGWK